MPDTDTPGVVIPFTPVLAGIAHTGRILRILGDLKRAGALGVRMPIAAPYPGQLQELYRKTHTKRMVVVGRRDLWKEPQYAHLTKDERIEKWTVRHVHKLMEMYDPEIVVVDQERGTHAHPEMVDIIEAEAPFGVPIYYYRGDHYFWPGVGSGPCDSLYNIWKQGKHPLDVLNPWLDTNSVENGYPWLTFYYDISSQGRGLITKEQLVPVCRRLRAAGALGYSLNPSPHTRPHLRLMQAGARVWQ